MAPTAGMARCTRAIIITVVTDIITIITAITTIIMRRLRGATERSS